MLAPWVMEEMNTVDLSDKRLNDRLRELLAQFSERPTASIPAACGGYAEMAAAYRFFDNERVTFDDILAPHQESTQRRIAAQRRVILAQDTTEVDLTRPDAQVAGAGPLDDGARRGALLHVLQAFTPDGTPLGTVAAEAWTREDDSPAKNRKQTPIEEKESQRWVDGLRQAQRVARDTPDTQIICVADSEADIFEVLVEAQASPRSADWIVRACHDRALDAQMRPNGEETAAVAHSLFEQVAAQEVLFTKTIRVRGRKSKVACETRGRRQARVSRPAEVEVRAARVALRPPYRPDRKLPAVEVNVVLVREINPPPGEQPVEWLLLTSLPIDTADAVREVIQCYTVRWMIEVFFRTLKSGCRIEERRFETLPRLLNCLAVYLIVDWRTLYVCRLGRSCPDISCEAVFEPAEWKAVYRVVQGKMPPAEPPKLQQMVRMVAQLGGYVNKSRKDDPGPQTIWLGLARAHDFALCWQLFGPEAQKEYELV
jgi:hypothetical protein